MILDMFLAKHKCVTINPRSSSKLPQEGSDREFVKITQFMSFLNLVVSFYYYF